MDEWMNEWMNEQGTIAHKARATQTLFGISYEAQTIAPTPC